MTKPIQKIKTAEMEGSERAKRTANKATDQVIVALRRRLEEMKLRSPMSSRLAPSSRSRFPFNGNG